MEARRTSNKTFFFFFNVIIRRKYVEIIENRMYDKVIHVKMLNTANY